MKKLWLMISILSILTSCQSVSTLSKTKYQEALSAWEKGQKENAVAFMEEAIQNSPRYYEAHIQLGNFYRDMNDYENSLAQYDLAIKLAPSDPEGWLSTGETCVRWGRFLKGEKKLSIYLKGQYHFSKVLGFKQVSEEEEFRATLGKGICLLNRTLTEDARKYLNEALALNEDDIDAIFYNAVLREQEMGPNKKSMDTYEEVLERKPDHLDALKKMGDLFKALGMNQKGLDYYKKFIEAGGSSSDIDQWVADQERLAAEQNDVPQQAEIIMVCPECGRIGKQGQTICDFDGTELIAQTEPEITK